MIKNLLVNGVGAVSEYTDTHYPGHTYFYVDNNNHQIPIDNLPMDLYNAVMQRINDIPKQNDVVVNPVTGILQPAQNVVSPVTPDLQNAEITKPFVLTAEQSAALDASVAGLDFSNIPAGGFSPLLGMIDINTPTMGGGTVQKTNQDINQQNLKAADDLLKSVVSTGTLSAAAAGDSAASVEVSAAAAKIINDGGLTLEVSHILSQKTLVLAGTVNNAALSPDDKTNAQVVTQIAVQGAVVDNDVKEAALKADVDNASSADAYNSAAMALKAHQEQADAAAITLAQLQAAQPEVAKKVADLVVTKASPVTSTTAAASTNFFDKIVNYIYNTLYK
jgi:hypothetical protein